MKKRRTKEGRTELKVREDKSYEGSEEDLKAMGAGLPRVSHNLASGTITLATVVC